MRSTVLTHHFVVNRSISQRHFNHVSACRIHCFSDCDRHFLRFAFTHSDSAIAITDNSEGGKTQCTSAFHYLSDAVNRDHLFLETIVAAVVLHAGLKLRHFRIPFSVRLELKASFACRFRESFYAPVICEPGPIKGNLVDTCRLGFLSDTLANGAGSSHVAAFAGRA